jgi:hypothetical protein
MRPSWPSPLNCAASLILLRAQRWSSSNILKSGPLRTAALLMSSMRRFKFGLTFAIIQEFVSPRQTSAEERSEPAPDLAGDEEVPVGVGRPTLAWRQARFVRGLGGAVDGISHVQCIDEAICDSTQPALVTTSVCYFVGSHRYAPLLGSGARVRPFKVSTLTYRTVL